MIILMGKTASGKDTLLNILVTKYGFKKLTTYTTRPMRSKEQQDITYHFISHEDFNQKVREGFFAEWKNYTTLEGIWYYGTAKEDLLNADDKTIAILTPRGYRDIKESISEKSKAILIYSNLDTIRKRLKIRGDNKNEIERRIKHDIEDFKGVENEVDRIIYNNNGESINEVANKIINFLED